MIRPLVRPTPVAHLTPSIQFAVPLTNPVSLMNERGGGGGGGPRGSRAVPARCGHEGWGDVHPTRDDGDEVDEEWDEMHKDIYDKEDEGDDGLKALLALEDLKAPGTTLPVYQVR